MRDGGLIETSRMRALPEGDCDYMALFKFLRLYCDALQIVVNRVWSLDEVLSIATLHRMFYHELRRYGFKTRCVKQVYVYARAVAKASKVHVEGNLH
ncbi:MAG: hypothetical protein QXM43_02625 [Desulfurococcaceae archaeon]